MTVFLICENCATKEEMRGDPTGCPQCGSARFAENEYGAALVLWADRQSPSSWEPGFYGDSFDTIMQKAKAKP